MKTQELKPIDLTDCDADFICSDSVCQGEESAKIAVSSENWNLMIKDGEYFFQHQDPNYVTGKLTMIEPGIVDGRAKAIFIEDNQEYFQVLDDEEKINAIIEDNYEVKRLVERANAWIRISSPSFDK